MDEVPAHEDLVSATQVLSNYNDQQQVCVMHMAGFHSSRVGMHFEDKYVSAETGVTGTAENEQNQAKVWFLNVLRQAGWQEYFTESENKVYYANDLLKLHQWKRPQVFPSQMPPCAKIPKLNHLPKQMDLSASLTLSLTHTESDAVKAPMRHLAHGPATGPLRHNYEECFAQLHHRRFNDHVA